MRVFVLNKRRRDNEKVDIEFGYTPLEGGPLLGVQLTLVGMSLEDAAQYDFGVDYDLTLKSV